MFNNSIDLLHKMNKFLHGLVESEKRMMNFVNKSIRRQTKLVDSRHRQTDTIFFLTDDVVAETHFAIQLAIWRKEY
jgi:hypothetical protein